MSGPAAGRPVLALETSTRHLGIALGREGEPPLELELDPDRPHASDLAPLAAECLERAGVQLGELGGLVVGIGPGSFTGLRVAVALALGLERAVGLPLLGVPSFEALLGPERGAGTEFDALVVGDARGGRVYAAHYAVGPDVSVRAAPEAPLLQRLDAWLAERRFDSPPRIWADPSALERICAAAEDGGASDAARTVADVLRARCGEFEPAAPIRPTASGLLALGAERLARGRRTPPGELRPLYLSRFGQRD